MSTSTATKLALEASEDPALVQAFCAGDRRAFEALVKQAVRPLRAVVRRMIGHPEDTEELVQEALLRAWRGRSSFAGRARFSTWLCSIGTNLAVDHLRRAKRWRAHAQIAYANECTADETLGMEVGGVLMSDEFRYEAREHIAYCFVCVGRSLAPEQQAALVLREVLGLSNKEAATIAGVSESVLRHHLSDARSEMTQRFAGLCSLVDKTGLCWQCEGLREATPEARRGPSLPIVDSLDRRLQIVREADVDRGVSQAMHDLFWRRTAELEADERGDATSADCGKPSG